ncbi:MAG TPA: DMT family transporter [Patescibacteria group bacterium]|nr:DMT family transporter [Patescibacteria group bacterium]
MSTASSNLLLLTASIIWGFAFVAQRLGMDHLGPFTFNGIRFALGSLSLIPLLLFFPRKEPLPTLKNSRVLIAGCIAGLILFAGASLQQVALLYTTAGKAAFVTCLYIVLVPLLGIFLQRPTTGGTWLGALLAIAGLYLLCVKESFLPAYGDFLVLLGAFFWSGHILWIDHFARRVDVIQLAFCQFVTCAVLSLTIAARTEIITENALTAAAAPLLYGGLASVGVAYTLQIVGQKYAPPAHAAIILSMETVFAAIGGYIFLDEVLTGRELSGCVVMLAGMLVSQLSGLSSAPTSSRTEIT